MAERALDPSGRFDIVVAPGWVTETDPDEGGLILFRPESEGNLELLSFPFTPEEDTDPADELFAFLDEEDILLLEDEVEDFALAGGTGLALCEYVSEEQQEDEGAEQLFWLVAVATGQHSLVFATYSCPAGLEDGDRGDVAQMLRSLRLDTG